jgi:integrase
MARPRTGSVTYNKRRKYWEARLDWADENGKGHCRKRKVENKSEGNRVVKQWIRELDEYGQAYLDADRITFVQLADEYQKERLVAPIYKDGAKVAGLRDWKGQRNRLAYLKEYFGKKLIRSITAADLEKYRNARLQTPVQPRKRKPNSKTKTPAPQAKERSVADVNRSLALLRTMFTFAVQSGWLTRNPFALAKGIISTALEVTRDRVLSTAEQRALLNACRHPDRIHIFPLILTALDSGARRNELLTLQWCNLDLEAGLLRITAENAKTNRERSIDLEPVTVGELRKLKEMRGDTSTARVFGLKNNYNKSLRSAMREAKIEAARGHDLRATAITFWLLRGMRTEFAMQRSGHTDPKTFQRYVRMCEEIRQKQREQLTEWELATSLTALTESVSDVAPVMAQIEAETASEFVN